MIEVFIKSIVKKINILNEFDYLGWQYAFQGFFERVQNES